MRVYANIRARLRIFMQIYGRLPSTLSRIPRRKEKRAGRSYVRVRRIERNISDPLWREFLVVVRDASTATTWHAGYILVNRARERPPDFGLRLPACARIGTRFAGNKATMSMTVRARDATSRARFRPAQIFPVSKVLSAIVFVSIKLVIVSTRDIKSVRAYIAASPESKIVRVWIYRFLSRLKRCFYTS